MSLLTACRALPRGELHFQPSCRARVWPCELSPADFWVLLSGSWKAPEKPALSPRREPKAPACPQTIPFCPQPAEHRVQGTGGRGKPPQQGHSSACPQRQEAAAISSCSSLQGLAWRGEAARQLSACQLIWLRHLLLVLLIFSKVCDAKRHLWDTIPAH